MTHPLDLRLCLRYIYTISISWTIVHSPQFTQRYCGRRGGAIERSCIAQEATSLVKIRTVCPEDKKGTVHIGAGSRGGIMGIGEKIDDIRLRDLTQFFRHPLSVKFIGEIKALRDTSRLVHPFSWKEALRSLWVAAVRVDDRSRATGQHWSNEGKSSLANLWVPVAASAGRFTVRYINGQFHPCRSIASLV